MNQQVHDELMPHIYHARRLCEEGGHRLLYLTLFGSHLYGTHSENSDYDLVGIMLPNKNNLLLGKKVNAIRFSTGNEHGKNTKDDIDIVIYSLQYWLLEKLNKLEVNAVDLLYSYSNKNCIMWEDPGITDVFENANKLFSIDPDPKAKHAYIDYAKNQVAKYGLKGTRVGVMKRIIELHNASEDLKDFINGGVLTLGECAKNIVRIIDDADNCYIEKGTLKKEGHKPVDFLNVCGKQHQFTITMVEFLRRIGIDYARCGDRARLAMENEGVDWKACSHALRSLEQMEQLFENCEINFPLQNTELLKQIKKGDLPWKDVEQIILNKFDQVKAMDKSNAINHFKRDWSYIKNFILKFYTEI